VPVSAKRREELRKCLGDACSPPSQPQAVIATKTYQAMTAGLREPREVHTLAETRQENEAGRVAALNDTDPIYVTMAPTGSGKTHADTAAVKQLNEQGGRSLTLVPDHKQCREVSAMRSEAGAKSLYFPQLNEDTCDRYDEAEVVMSYGLSATAALCPDCPNREYCTYREQYQAAKAAMNAIGTHARAAAEPRLLSNRQYITIHEQPLDMVRPSYLVNRGLKTVAEVAEQASYGAKDANDRAFYRYMAEVARRLHGEFEGSNETYEVALPKSAQHVPRDLHAALYAAVRDGEGCRPPADAMRLVLAAVQGRLVSIDVTVNETRSKGGEIKLTRSITGVGQTELPDACTILFNDATADLEEYRAIFRPRTVQDITPRGKLALMHPVLQIIPKQDVTRKTGPCRAGEIVQGVLNDLPYQRIGLITHRPQLKKLSRWLEENGVDTGRITKVSYFGNESRGSNDWIGNCDALIIIGTPRVPPSSIRRHLLLLGKRAAARLTAAEAGWHLDRWQGLTESGKEVDVRTGHYRDPDWHAAYLSLVRSELRQAIGRGRGLLPNGIPVFAVTTENLGDTYCIADHPFARLTQKQALALAYLKDSTAERPVMTSVFANLLECSLRRANEILNRLLEDGRVKRRGKKGGWYLAPLPGGGSEPLPK
jgi:hypothetical protein